MIICLRRLNPSSAGAGTLNVDYHTGMEGLPVREGAAQGNTNGVAKRINTINRMDLRNLQGYRDVNTLVQQQSNR